MEVETSLLGIAQYLYLYIMQNMGQVLRSFTQNINRYIDSRKRGEQINTRTLYPITRKTNSSK